MGTSLTGSMGRRDGLRRLLRRRHLGARGVFTASTGQSARGTTYSVTLPMNSRLSPVRPWVPMTISPQSSSAAARRISSAASPRASRASTGYFRSGPSMS